MGRSPRTKEDDCYFSQKEQSCVYVICFLFLTQTPQLSKWEFITRLCFLGYKLQFCANIIKEFNLGLLTKLMNNRRSD